KTVSERARRAAGAPAAAGVPPPGRPPPPPLAGVILGRGMVMATWAVAKKEFRLLLRDRLSAVILLLMPLLFVLVLKLLLDEDRLRVTVVDLDKGDYYQLKPDDLTRAGAGTAGLFAPAGGASSWQTVGVLFAEQERAFHQFPAGRWADVVLRDLRETA